MEDPLTLADLVEASGLPARTIRFYISRGLLDGPVKGGRGAAYSKVHAARLARIQKLQQEGRTLSDIGRILGGIPAEPVAAPVTPWWQHAIAEDVVVWVRADGSPWRTKELRDAIDEFARRVQAAAGRSREEEGDQ